MSKSQENDVKNYAKDFYGKYAHEVSYDFDKSQKKPSWYSEKWVSGGVLEDRSEKGKDRNWRKRKLSNLSIHDAFEAMQSRGGISVSLVDRIRKCAEVLMFEIPDLDGVASYPKLKRTFFCKNKLCPICNWRRALKHSYTAGKVIEGALKEKPKAQFLFLTLTVKNCDGADLKDELKKLMKAFDRLFKRTKVKKNLIGYLRALEVTYNAEKKQYHPHFHVLLMVKSTYFKSKADYIEQDEWTKLWQQSLKVDYTPIVDIKKVKPGERGLSRAAVETAKYPVKPLNFKDIGDDEIVNVVSTLYYSLGNTRQLAYGGLLREIYAELNADEENLVNVSDDDGAKTVGELVFAAFDYGRRNYFWAYRKND